MVVEEAAHIRPEIFYEVVVPIYTVGATALALLSSPSEGFFSEIIKVRKPDGSPLANIVEEQLACGRCQRAGIASECPHMKHLVAPWKNAEKMDEAKLLYGKKREALYLREAAGVEIESGCHFFNRNSVRKFIDRRIASSDIKRPRWVLIFVDPNGADSPSSDEMAIIAVFFSGRELAVRNWIGSTINVPCPKGTNTCDPIKILSSTQKLGTCCVDILFIPNLKPTLTCWINP